ncbi:MAG: hypothetical protein JNK45_12285 [Myxococcales bacterium]|nr:hypothetical protein [Myxococcales bacterium]
MPLPFVALLLAIPEPCYGFDGASLEGEHVWVDYPTDISEAQAMRVVEAADTAWAVYAGELGWAEPQQAIAVRAEPSNDMAAGQCITVDCDGVDVPRCFVFGSSFDVGAEEQTAAHELGHAFQYALMGNYLDSLTSWAWWMEGTASWIETYYAPHPRVWGRIDDYLANPQWTLQNDFSDLVSGGRGGHMYGTAVLAFFLDQNYGPDTVRATWEWGAAMSGEKIFFRDAIEGIGLSFAEVWPHYLATITVLDLDGGEEAAALPRHSVLEALPGSGTPPAEDLPEGLGFAVFHVPAQLGMPGTDLHVQIHGDPSVPWHTVVARTDGVTPGSAVLDYVVATWDDAGHGELLLPAFDGSRDAFVAVSPESSATGPFAFSISAELVPTDAGDSSTTAADTTAGIDGTTAGEASGESGAAATAGAGDDASGCSCRSAGRPGWAVLLLSLLPSLPFGARRRRR